MPHPLIIEKAKELYIKYRGRCHREIEREMHALDYTTFTRRVLYSRKYKNGKRNVGWIEKYSWRDDLRTADTPVRMSAKHEHHASQNSYMMSKADRPTQAETRAVASVSVSEPTADRRPGLSISTGVDSQPPTAGRQPPTDFPAWLKRTSSRMTWRWPYQQLIYEKLQAVTDGTCKRLMIFLPPRHGKSELVTVRYSAWRLQQDPTLNIILGSYNQRLANRFSRKVRIALEDAQQVIENGEVRIDNENASVSSPHVPGPPPQHPRAGWQSNGSAKEIEQQTAESDDRSKLTSSNSQLSILNSPLPSLRRRLNTVAEWETGLGGGVRAVGVGGGITGFGADLVIIDDPVRSRAEAESRTYRDKTYEWFCDDLYTRLEPNASIILIQTRWHEDDLAGRLLRDAEEDGAEQWDVISLPALAEAAIDNGELRIENEKPASGGRSTTVNYLNADISVNSESPKGTDNIAQGKAAGRYPGYAAEQNALPVGEQQNGDGSIFENKQSVVDEPSSILHSQLSILNSADILGRQPGEPLCPERFSRDDLLRIKRKLGTYSFSALYQQRPTPPEGGLFKRKWFSRIVDRPPDDLKWVRAYDLAISMRDTADYTASFRCALDRKTGELYISDGFRKRIEFPDQKHLIMQKMSKERDTEHGIEEALHGLAFIQELRREHRVFGRAFRGIRVTADKFTRALSWANLAEEGKVVLVRGSSTPGQTGSAWIEDFLDEVTTFPNSAHDDQVDAVSLAVQMLEKRKHLAIGF